MNTCPPKIPRPPENPENDPVAQASYENAMEVKAWKVRDQAIAAQMSPSPQYTNMTSQELREAAEGADNIADTADDTAVPHLSDLLDGNAD